MNENTWFIDTYGLSAEQRAIVCENVPVKNCEVYYTDCFTDIIAMAPGGMANIVMWDQLREKDIDLLIGYYSEIAPFSETLILIGDVDMPKELRKHVLIYDTFEDFSENMKYVLLNAYRKTKKDKSFSKTLANTITILSEIRKKPYTTTKELAEKLELSERTVQRYIETLRAAGEWLDYDVPHKGWKLTDGKSLLWGDV